MSEPSSLRVLSLGAGVQSTTLALMSARGEIEPIDHAIFADTQNETLATYRHLAWLGGQLPFPIHHVTRGNLGDDFLAVLAGTKKRCAQPPFFSGTGMLHRQCTKEYKLELIRRKVRELSRGKPVDQLIGISTDEAHRMKQSDVKYITNRYPLVELRMSRGDCMAWLQCRQYKMPPKSACYFCPYTNDRRWMQMKQDAPAEWERACAFDEAVRAVRAVRVADGIKGEIFVHRSLTPLRTADLGDEDTLDLFGEECAGVCGV